MTALRLRRGSRTGRLAATVVVAIAAVPGVAWGDSGEPAIPPYSAGAAADGMKLSVNIPGAPLSADVINGGGPTARAVISSVGVRRAFAALPDPGEGATAGPGTAAGALGTYGIILPAEVPAYPFGAVAEYPNTPEQEIGQGLYTLKATSAERKATGEAQAGILQEGAAALAARSEAFAEELDDGVVVRSAALFKGLAVGPLSFTDVKSTAQVVLGPDGALQRSSSLDVVGGRAGDTAFAFTPEGIVFGGSTVPVSFAEGLKSLNQQLEPTSVRIGFIPQRETTNGVIAPVLEITSPVKSLNPGLADGTMSLRLGASSAAIETEGTQAEAAEQASRQAQSESAAPPPAQPAPAEEAARPGQDATPSPELPDFEPAVPSELRPTVRATPSASFSAVPGPVVDSAGLRFVDTSSAAGDASDATVSPAVPDPGPASLAEPVPATAVASQLAARSTEEAFGSETLYLVLAAATAAGVLSIRLVRVGGRWNS